MILKIRKTKDPVLREPTEKVDDFGHEFQFLIDNMIETMRKNNGVGLAAPQVGLSHKMFICEYEGEEDDKSMAFPLTVVVNPEIIELGKEEVNMVEGCLSFPGMEILTKRPKTVIISGQDRYGKSIKIEADGLYSRVLQHENDHLNATLLIDHIQETSVMFIGTGDLGAKSLELLAHDSQYKVVSVITGADEAIQRRNNVGSTNPIETIANKLKLPLIKTKSINDPKMIAEIKKNKPELGIMADFGQIVSQEVLDIPKYGVINIHPSLLPKYRGPSPIQQTILSGDKEAGVSLILTSQKMDAGPIISQTITEISPSETYDTLKELMSEIGAVLLLNSIPYYLAGDLKPIEQDESKATYTKLIKNTDAEVTKETPSEIVERKIRAFSVWPKVFTIVNGKRVQILAGYMDEENNFVITSVKPEGKNEMSYEDFVRGYKTKLTFS